MSQGFKDYYNVLNISFSAEDNEIKAAYRKLARENHPDMHPDQSEYYTQKFQEISEAYETLSDADKKLSYDYNYRRYVLNEEPQYEYYEDDTPPNTSNYAHRYTRRTRVKASYFPYGILVIFVLQLFRGASCNSTPEFSEVKFSNSQQISENIRQLVDSLNRTKSDTMQYPALPPQQQKDAAGNEVPSTNY